MKRMMIFACAMLFAVASKAQWDLEGLAVDKSKWIDFAPAWNPDPYIMTPGAGSAGSVQQNAGMSKGKGPRMAPQKADAVELPDHWDNGKTKYFPPVFSQAGGSCGVSSRAGYMLCEELNAYRGTDASHPDNRLAPNVQHPFDNTGPNKNTMAYQIGFPSVSTYGGFPYSNLIGFYGPESDAAGWMQGYNKWYKTMHNRIWGSSSIPTPVIGYPEDNPDDWGLGGFGPGALAAKRWLYNHNGDESFQTGGLLGLGVSSGYNLIKIPATTENRKNGLTNMVYWVPGTSVDHAMTMCGYDDRVEFDIDGNGKVGERKNSDGYDERGAWIVVNSWGNWGNNGFVYVPYALAAPTCKKNASGKGYLPVGNGFTPEMWHIRKDYTPARTIKLKISFTQRSAISLKAGISTNLKASSPQKTLTFEHFNYKGDGNNDGKDAMTPLLGKWADGMHYEPMEFGFDLSDLMADFDPTQPLKFFFIVESKSTATGVGGIHEASIIDYTYNPNGIETPFVIAGDSVVIGNKGKRTSISTIVYGEAINPPTNLKISGTTLSWEAPQTSFTPTGYIIYKNDTEIAQTEGSVKSYNVGTGEGTYTVKAIYELNGQRKLSASSASVEGNYAFSKRYITKVGSPISKLSELTDGMTVILYNTGRAKYICDAGTTNYQHRAAAPKKGQPNSSEYIFTVHKVGNTFTFTSENGSLPAFEANNVGIPVSDTPGQFTVTLASSSEKTFLLKNGSWYLNGNENAPVTWNAGDNNSKHRITPVECDPEIQGLEDYTTVTAENLMEGQIVALYNNGRGYFITDENDSYGISKTEPTGQSYNYLFRVGKNADGTFTFTSQSGAIPALPHNATFAPGNTAENFTLTSAGTGLFHLQGATAVASAGGQQERQYLNGSETAPIGWNSTDANSVYRLYPVKTSTTEPSITIAASTPIQVFAPVQLSLNGDADIASCVWTVEDKTYTSTSPTVVFTTAGSKVVECTAVNMRGMTATAKRTLTVQAAPELSAEFTMSKEQIAGGEAVSFLATNQLAGCSYHWDLPGTQMLTADTRNVSVVYIVTGEHQVTLTVTAPDGTTKTNTQTIAVQQVPPAPDFSLSDAVIQKGESVTITDETLYGPTAWVWTLLEEKNLRYQSTEQHPTFTPAPGRYELQVTATNEVGSGTFTRKRALLVCNAPSLTGLEFAGGNSRVTANLPEGITNAWTIDFWMNPTSLDETSAGIFGSNELKLTSDADGTATLKRGNTTLSASGNGYYVAGEWHHYAITYGSGTVIFYRDGMEFSRAACSTRDFTNHFTSLQIGGAEAPLQGMIDEFRVWGKTLAVNKLRGYAVAPIANVSDAEQNDGLLLYYQFNQTGGNCADATSYGNEGTRRDFGPDGDAWSESRGVFAINFDNGGGATVGGMLNQTFYRVVDASRGEQSAASKVVDGKDDTMWQPETAAYPLSITLDRDKLDEILALRFHSSRGNDVACLPTSLSIYESDDASTWTTVLEDRALGFSGNYSDIMLPDAITRRYVKIEFPSGGAKLALNEIYFFGKEGEVVDNEDGQSDSGYTITWRICDKTGGEFWKIYKQKNVAQGTRITKLPDAYRIKGCNYSAVSATVEGDVTIDVRCTWPTSMFTPSTPENPVYHNLRVNGKYARWDAATGRVSLKATKPATDEEIGKWAFFGNPYAGYLVVNAAEPRVFLSCLSSDKSYSVLDGSGTRFNASSSSYSGGGFLLQVIQNVSYLNDYANEGQLATWADAKASSGVGSAFKATVVSGGSTGIETVEIEPFADDNYYTIGGVKLNGKPTAKGVYIHRGKKIIVN